MQRVALQVGSLVPADSARLHVLDAVHTRMGASDNLAMGSSTFLEVCHTTLTPIHLRCFYDKGNMLQKVTRGLQIGAGTYANTYTFTAGECR